MPRSKQHRHADLATKKDIRLAVEELAAATQKGFLDVNKRFGKVDKRLASADKKFISIDKRFAAIDKRFDEVDKRFDEVDKRFTEVDKRFTEVNAKIDTMKDEIIREFKVVAENIHQDVAGANKDEISLIKDQLIPDHETRIQILEKHSGLPVSPHY